MSIRKEISPKTPQNLNFQKVFFNSIDNLILLLTSPHPASGVYSEPSYRIYPQILTSGHTVGGGSVPIAGTTRSNKI